MDNETREMFNVVLGEIDKLAERMDKRFEKMDKKFEKMDAKINYVYESLSHEINVCKLNGDTVSLLVDKTEELDNRVRALEEKQKRRQRFRLV